MPETVQRSQDAMEARARAELQFALLDALANRESYGVALERARSEPPGAFIDCDALTLAADARERDTNSPVTRSPASRVLEEAASSPLRGAFLARALNALASITAEISETALSEAVSASNDFEVLVRALERAIVRGRSPEEMDHDALLDEAQLRGVRARNRLLAGEGGSISAKEAAERLHISRQAIDDRRKKGRLIGLNIGRRGYAYPAWQFDDVGVLPGLEPVLRALADLEPWSQVAFMLNPNSRLHGERPLALLRRGHGDDVHEAARAYGEQGGS